MWGKFKPVVAVFIRKVLAFCVMFSGDFNLRSKNREIRTQLSKSYQLGNEHSFIIMCSARGDTPCFVLVPNVVVTESNMCYKSAHLQ